MNIEGIVKNWLQKNGYDGLCSEDCGCEMGDLMPCGEPQINCKPGYKVPCPGPDDCENGGGCPWHICETKPSKGTAK